MTKASFIALLCLLVGAISAAEIDFKHNRANVRRPVVVPVVPHQIKRQGETYNFGANSGVRSVNSNSFRQQQSSESQVPLQQPYRSSAESSPQRQGATGGRPKQVPLEQSKTPSSVNSEPSTAFQQRARDPSHPPPSEEIFAPFTAENSRPSSSRPFRQSNSRPFSSSVEQRQGGSNSPQFEGGFPDGFTSGLPAFDFQGRMPEPDEKSEGFMDGALNGFPNLKSFGGFGPLPEVAQEDSIPSKQRQGSGRPDGFRLGQFSGRPLAN